MLLRQLGSLSARGWHVRRREYRPNSLYSSCLWFRGSQWRRPSHHPRLMEWSWQGWVFPTNYNWWLQALQGPQQGRATKLLSMSWQQLFVVVGLLTGHLGLYGHLHKIEKDINPLCRRCLNGNKTVEHLLCECESLTMSGVTFLDKFLESFNNSHMFQWIYFDSFPQK